MPIGTLFLVVAPEGMTGSLLEQARSSFARESRVVIPRRVMTRAPDGGAELYQAVTPAQFDRMRRNGAFVLCWSGEGVNYGIPATLVEDLSAGKAVVIQVDRSVVPLACRKFGRAVVLEDVPAALVAIEIRQTLDGRRSPLRPVREVRAEPRA